MCRRNKMWGLILVAFGLGLLIGQCLERGFWCSAGSITILVVGISLMRQK